MEKVASWLQVSNPDINTTKLRPEVLSKAMIVSRNKGRPAGLIIDHSCRSVLGKASRVGLMNSSRRPANRNALCFMTASGTV